MPSKINILASVAQASALGVMTSQAVASSAMLTPSTFVYERNVESDSSFELSVEASSIKSSESRTYSESANEWTKKLQKRFDILLIKKIEKSISQDERNELDRLTYLRRQKAPSRTADEIMRTARRQKIILEMNEVLRKYVEFSTDNQRNQAEWYPKKAQSA